MRVKCYSCVAMAVFALAGMAGCHRKEPEEAQPAPVATVPPVGQAKAQEAKKAEPQKEIAKPAKARKVKNHQKPVGESLINAPADYLRTVTITVPRHAEKTLDNARFTNELRQFQVTHDRYPKSIEEWEKWRGEPLGNPPPGYEYKYDASTGKLSINSVP
ncbi:MAG: hypothetical protein J7M08_07015 [Planctomycetes bacterium]|nr:hypothetical protein [Planctomycetota bacterium]